jgi:hypothetical protein
VKTAYALVAVVTFGMLGSAQTAAPAQTTAPVPIYPYEQMIRVWSDSNTFDKEGRMLRFRGNVLLQYVHRGADRKDEPGHVLLWADEADVPSGVISPRPGETPTVELRGTVRVGFDGLNTIAPTKTRRPALRPAEAPTPIEFNLLDGTVPDPR